MVLLLFSDSRFSGPSNIMLAPNVVIPIFPVWWRLLPSRVVMSIIDDIRPPYSAPKPPVYMSALSITSVSNTENNPIEWKGLYTDMPSSSVLF